MDRLHLVIAGAALALAGAGATGCEKKGGGEQQAAPDPTGRVDEVHAVQKKAVTVDEFCDVRPKSPAEAKKLALPPLAPGQAAPAGGTWRWVNVWATWCKPCVEEIPRLAGWQKKLAGEGLKYDLVFVSDDSSDADVATFRAAHSEVSGSLRIASPDALPAWLGAVGIGEGAPIPIHLFVDPQDRVMCVRAGGVRESDLPAIRQVLGG